MTRHIVGRIATSLGSDTLRSPDSCQIHLAGVGSIAAGPLGPAHRGEDGLQLARAETPYTRRPGLRPADETRRMRRTACSCRGSCADLVEIGRTEAVAEPAVVASTRRIDRDSAWIGRRKRTRSMIGVHYKGIEPEQTTVLSPAGWALEDSAVSAGRTRCASRQGSIAGSQVGELGHIGNRGCMAQLGSTRCCSTASSIGSAGGLAEVALLQ